MRQPIGARLRFTILERDEFTCQYCGSTPRDVKLEVDHINPAYLVGKNDESNLITSCKPCNIGKNKHKLNGILPKYSQKISLIGLLEEHYRPELQEICDVWYTAYQNKPLDRMSFALLLQYKRHNEAIIVDALKDAIALNNEAYFAYNDWVMALDDNFIEDEPEICNTSISHYRKRYKVISYLKPTN